MARHDTPSVRSTVEDSLARCLRWSQEGRHGKVLAEVERLLPQAEVEPEGRAILLIWKAHALLATGHPEKALRAAATSWDLRSSPHACHIMSSALDSMGALEEAEEYLRLGWSLYPEAVHLPVQLAILLAEQGRVPEAYDALEEVPAAKVPPELDVFLAGLRVNLLVAMGRWAEAAATVDAAVSDHPESAVLEEARRDLNAAWNRQRSQRRLQDSWRASLAPELQGIAHEVDESVVRCARVLELPELPCLAARRLWRAYWHHAAPRLAVPDAWGAALVLAVLELDGDDSSAADIARATRTKPGTVRAIRRRLHAYLAERDPEFTRRAFAAFRNPQLEQPEDETTDQTSRGPGQVVRFPAPGEQ